jgi:hypothetical protein
MRQVAHRLVLDLAVLAVGAAQQMSAVGLAPIGAAGGGYMDGDLTRAHVFFIGYRTTNSITFSGYIPGLTKGKKRYFHLKKQALAAMRM